MHGVNERFTNSEEVRQSRIVYTYLPEQNEVFNSNLALRICQNPDTQTNNDLAHLNMSSKGFIHFPIFEWQLSLRVLEIQYNFIQEISNFSYIKNLEVLNISNNYISEIKDLYLLQMLKTLNFSHNKINRIQNLNQSQNLRTLNLRMNRIKAIENLDALVNLRNLDLSHNLISVI